MTQIVIEMEACSGCCDNIVAAGILACRIKGAGVGEASICGWSEYTTPSTPPKKYRTQYYAHDYIQCGWTGHDCIPTTLASTHSVVDDGESTFNGDTCASGTVQGVEHYGGQIYSGVQVCQHYGGVLNFSQANADAGNDMVDPPSFIDGFFLQNLTTTVVDYEGTGECVDIGANSYVFEGYRVWQLDIEDTEDDAITRFGADNEWSEWEAVGGSCPNPGCCVAYRQQRTSGFDFAFQDAQWRVTAGALTPSTAYNVVTRIYRREYGSSDPWELYSSIVTPTTSDGSGDISVEGDVPNASGYESYAATAFITNP